MGSAEAATTVVVRHEPARRGRWLIAGGIVAAALVLSLAWLGGRSHSVATDRRVVAIAPFRVTGADSSLRYLREGMVDLLATKLGGTAGLRPADPRSLLAAWSQAARNGAEPGQSDAVRVAAEVGAGRLVEGEVVGTGRRLTLTARITEVPSGTAGAQAAIEGSADSLTQLVDRLAARLLALESGEEEQRLDALTSTSLPALRAYLDGEALLRRGRFEAALRRFGDAVALDSTFALANLGAARAGEWWYGDESGAIAAWRHRERLSTRDVARLETILGPRYPSASGAGDLIHAAERFAALAPDSPDAWYKVADHMFHLGALAGIDDHYRRAAAAFDRSLALDSTYAPTIQHLSEIATRLDDTVGIRRGLDLLLRVDSVSSNAEGRRWQVAAALHDTAAALRALASDSIVTVGPYYVVFFMLDNPLDLEGTDSLFPRVLARQSTEAERAITERAWYYYELIRGRPSRAAHVPSSHDPADRWRPVLTYLFADADSAPAAQAARELRGQLGRPLAARDEDEVIGRYAVGQYALAMGDTGIVRQAIANLEGATPDSGGVQGLEPPSAYALLLAAQLDRSRGEGATLVTRLDSALVNPAPSTWISLANLIAAQLHEQRGELPVALAALRRRYVGVADYPHYVRYLREQGRLAATLGHRDEAIRAYRHYLALRSDAEPRLQPEVQLVRQELAALQGGASR